MKILWLTPPGGFTEGHKFVLGKKLASQGMTLGDIFFYDVTNDVPDLIEFREIKNSKKRKAVVKKDKIPDALAAINKYYNLFNPRIIVCHNLGALRAITGIEDATLATYRGSVYSYSGVPVIILDDLQRINDTIDGEWILINDLGKLKRWYTNSQREQVRFAYKVCKTREDLDEARNYLLQCDFLGVDSETYDNWISSIQYTGITADGDAFTYVIPFFNPLAEGGAHWRLEDEQRAWEVVEEINGSDVWKILCNGAYDGGYFIKYRIVLKNYLLDIQYAWHCLYAQTFKSLDFIASIICDYYRFWKADKKGIQDEKIPPNQENLERFWRYGALDTYYTAVSARIVFKMLLSADWATRNYCDGEFPDQIGPALHMSCRGFRFNREALARHRQKWEAKYVAALRRARIAAANDDYNPGSWQQVAHLFYNVLGCDPVKVKGKSGGTDEFTLRLIGEQRYLFRLFADDALDVREAGKICSTYLGSHAKQVDNGEVFFTHSRLLRGNRMHFMLNTGGTDTSRYSSNQFMWEGMNGQNIPEHLRDMLIADDGWVLFDVDCEQADARFVAYEAQDEKYINIMESDKDTHCYHASHFFRQPYEHILAMVAQGVPLYAHKVTGIRQVTKKIVHGSNYEMMAYTLYTQILTIAGPEALRNIARGLGRDPSRMNQKAFVDMCGSLIEAYFVLYPRLRPWGEELQQDVIQTRLISTAFGWTIQIFMDPTSKACLRYIKAFKGQGGTGGCINRAIRTIYYGDDDSPPLEQQGVRLLLQVHDSLVGEVRESQLYLLEGICRAIERPITIHGRTFKIPSNPQIGYNWAAGGDHNVGGLQKIKRIAIPAPPKIVA